jgi:2-methylcitrate dehydratase PrpD
MVLAMDESDARSETAALAEWIADVRLSSVPHDVLEQAKHCILDSLGCMVAGVAAGPCQTMLEVFAEQSGGGEITVPGAGRKLPLLNAAYIAAQAANALDFDDAFRAGAPSHPGATVVPPALAVGEREAASGEDLLRAVIVGYEVSLRVGRAVQPTPERKAEVYGFSTWQIFGAAGTTASLLRLSAEAIKNALGLAAVHAPSPSLRKLGTEDPRPYPWIKNSYGAASQGGVLAGLLAARGYIASRNVFDGPQGFWIMSGSDRYRPELLTEGLGSTWLLREVGFKHYGCCRWTHTMLDAIRDGAGGLDPDAIESVDVHGFRELSRLCGGPPTSIIDAQFHAPHLAALELLGRSPARGLTDADLVDARVRRLAGKITLHHDAAADEPYNRIGSLPVRVIIKSMDGTVREAAAEHPTGSTAAGGYPEDALRAKFLRLASSRLGEDGAARALQAVCDLENRSVAEILGLTA